MTINDSCPFHSRYFFHLSRKYENHTHCNVRLNYRTCHAAAATRGPILGLSVTAGLSRNLGLIFHRPLVRASLSDLVVSLFSCFCCALFTHFSLMMSIKGMINSR